MTRHDMHTVCDTSLQHAIKYTQIHRKKNASNIEFVSGCCRQPSITRCRTTSYETTLYKHRLYANRLRLVTFAAATALNASRTLTMNLGSASRVSRPALSLSTRLSRSGSAGKHEDAA